MEAAPLPTFGDLLRRHRLAAGLSQEALAERAGLSARGVSDLERGVHRAPRRETVALLADALGLAEPERAALAAAVRRWRAPRARAAGNLPLALTSFVGRERELAEVGRLLGETRLLTLTGPGGVGKTRLALQAAAERQADFSDGVVFVDLAPIRDPALVPAVIATALGLREEAGRPLVDTLRAALRPRHQLLLLDNVEQVAAAAPLLDDLLRAAPRLTLMATSRVVLGVYSEHVVPVEPLAVPNRDAGPPPRPSEPAPAVRLFAARAAAAGAAAMAGAAEAAAVAEICRRLDGLPLAIELAAARARVLPPAALLARLERRLPLLTGGARTLPARQRTLRATLAWSEELLGPDERVFFRRLAAFVGGCTPEAAAAVCDADGDLGVDALDGLQALVEHSLLRSVASEDAAPRFAMLETVREYAAEQLERSGEAEALRRRHAAHALAEAEAAAPRLRGPDGRRWLARLAAEHADLRAALAWCEEHDPELGLRLANALWWFWELRGYRSEGYRWLTALLARPGAARPTAARARALHAASHLIDPDRKAELAALCRASLALAEQVGDRPARARALRDLGWATYFGAGDARGEAMIEASLALFQAGDVDWEAAEALRDLAEVARARGDPARAESLLREALAICRSVGDARGSIETLRDLGDPARADALLAESLALARELGDREAVAHALIHLAFGARARGDLAQAATWLEEALALFRAVGNQFHGAWALHDLGWVEQARGETARAAALVGDGLALFHERGHLEGVTVCLGTLGAIWLAQGRPAAVARLLGAAAALGEGAGVDLEPISRADAERSQAAARRQLEAAAWEAAWAAGRALTPAEAVAYALAEDAERSA